MRSVRSALISSLAGLALALTPTVATAGNGNGNGNKCPDLDTGRQEVEGERATVTIVAPAGYAIARVCIKAGSANHGDGPEEKSPPEGTTVWEVGYESGKDVSHW